MLDVLPNSEYSGSESTQNSASEDNPCGALLLATSNKCYQIKILQRTEDTSNEVTDPSMIAFDRIFRKTTAEGTGDSAAVGSNYRDSLLGVEDVDDDGNKEVFSIVREAGSGSYSIKIKLYDSLNKKTYELAGAAEHGRSTVNPAFTGDSPSKEEYASWMRQKIDELVLFNKEGKAQDTEWQQMTEEQRYNREVQNWWRNNGVGFYKGQPELEEFEGKIPESGGSVACSLDDGEFEWLSYFKGALFRYNKSNNTHSVVYIPESAYDWVSFMVSGKKYLWLNTKKDNGLLVFNKETEALEVIPVTEMQSSEVPQGRFDLRYANASLYLGNMPLSLPASLDEDELESAVACTSSNS